MKNTLTKKQVSGNKILQEIIEQMFNPDNVKNEYIKPWDASKFNLQGHRNPVTGTIYSGSNAFFLAYQQNKKNYDSFLWVTFPNMVKLFGMDTTKKIIKGEKYSNVFFYSRTMYEKKKDNEVIRDDNGNVVMGFSHMYKYYNVMNFSQLIGKDKDADIIIEKIESKYKPKNDLPEIPLTDVEIAMEKGLKLSNGIQRKQVDQACYSPSSDSITLPVKGAFKSIEHDISTFFHECSHATGHKSRLNRNLSGSFGGSAYAFEELIAEFSSSLCDNYFNIKCSEVSLNHVSYLSSWYKGLKKDPTKLISACSKAEEAFNFLVEATEKELNNMNKKVA